MAKPITVTRPDGRKVITTEKAESKRKANYGKPGYEGSGTSSKRSYSYTDKNTGKQMSTSSRTIADLNASGGYIGSDGGSYSLRTTDDIMRWNDNPAVRAARIMGSVRTPNFLDGTHFAYIDSGGITHVSNNPDIARGFSSSGDIYKYLGPTRGGYIVNDNGDRMMNIDPSKVGELYEQKYMPDIISSTVSKLRSPEAPPISTLSAPTPTSVKSPFSTGSKQISFTDTQGNKHTTGVDEYVQSQIQRYQDALARGDTDLINRLVADSKRVGYQLPDTTQSEQRQTQPQTWQEMFPMPQFQDPQFDVLSYDAAKQQAIEMLKPMYDSTRADLLNQSAIRSEQRGLGFSPLAEAIDLEIDTGLAGQYNQDVSRMANELVNLSQEQANRLTELALQKYGAEMEGWRALLDNYWRGQEHERNLGNDKFQQMIAMKELGLEEMKVRIAEDELDFKRWISEKNLDLDYAKLDLQERSMLVDKYIAEREISSRESMFNTELSWKSNQAAMDRDLKRELSNGKDAMATQQWISYMDEAIQDGDLQDFDDAFEIIMENWGAIQKDNADPYYVLEQARLRLGK